MGDAMPMKSKAQQKWMFAAEARGELPKGTAKRWADHTKDIKDLPEHVEKKSFIQLDPTLLKAAREKVASLKRSTRV